MTNFTHVGISCANPLDVERYYTKYFGFKRARVLPLGDTQIVFIKLGDAYLELFQAVGESPAPAFDKDGPAYPAWRHIAFHVDSVDDKLAEMGDDAVITQGPMDFDSFIPGWRTVWVKDPNGDIIEITQGYKDEDSPAPFPG